jgi:hypothetical protein
VGAAFACSQLFLKRGSRDWLLGTESFIAAKSRSHWNGDLGFLAVFMEEFVFGQLNLFGLPSFRLFNLSLYLILLSGCISLTAGNSLQSATTALLFKEAFEINSEKTGER